MDEIDNTNASEMLTDDALDAAFRAAEEGSEVVEQEEIKEEKVETKEEVVVEEEVILEEPPKTDNAERTRLGRRVANVEKKMDEFLNEIRQTIKPQTQTPTEQPELDFDPNAYVTVADLDKYIAYKQQREQGAKKAYEDAYMRELANASLDLDDKAADEVLSYLEKMPRQRTGNPQLDAKVHWLEAQNNLLKVKVEKKPTNPLDKNANKENKGISAASATKVDTTKSKPKLELTPDALAYIKKVGMSEEEAITLLS